MGRAMARSTEVSGVTSADLRGPSQYGTRTQTQLFVCARAGRIYITIVDSRKCGFYYRFEKSRILLKYYLRETMSMLQPLLKYVPPPQNHSPESYEKFAECS